MLKQEVKKGNKQNEIDIMHSNTNINKQVMNVYAISLTLVDIGI